MQPQVQKTSSPLEKIDLEFFNSSELSHHLGQAIIAYSLDPNLEGNPDRVEIINYLKLFHSEIFQVFKQLETDKN